MWSEAYLAVIEPVKEAGMQDYRLDARAAGRYVNSAVITELVIDAWMLGMLS